ncbi:hypothetical protein LSUB1_G007574 [Lachnellula subtilissima]|uniref:F-box domain-containing protein n=1 Tax=Lachnellula subtilissima TaxID=602034 RepID=A0A8H8RCZ8_9HELO|nr:hypothetical protein LSUB1_G007574 [Lachnellula subtilissima]
MPSLTFLDLPGEIRNQIYCQLLLVPSLSTARLLGDPPIYPAILSTCRKIHSETHPILYGSNTFLAHPNLLTGLPRLRLYYSTISSPILISRIRRFHIRVRLDNDPNFSAQKAQESFTGVEELTIEVFQAQYGSSDYKVLRLFEGVRGVERTRVYGSITGFPEYAEWLQNVMSTPVGKEVDLFDKEKVLLEKAVHVRSGDAYDIWIVSGRSACMGEEWINTKIVRWQRRQGSREKRDRAFKRWRETQCISCWVHRSRTDGLWALGMNAISYGKADFMPMKADAHPQLIEYLAQPRTRNTNSRFLDKLPIEIRNEVYKYLLYNTMLADLAHVYVVPRGLSGSKYVAYNLSPAILQTCRQVNAEASIVLYEINKFHYVATGPHNYLSDSRERQRILRYGCNPTISQPFQTHFPVAKKIRHWRVVINSQRASECLPRSILGEPMDHPTGLAFFALAFSQQSMIYRAHRHPQGHIEPQQYLAPLRSFRPLQSITFVDADSNNLPSVLTGAGGLIVYESNLLGQALEDEIRELVTGCTPL